MGLDGEERLNAWATWAYCSGTERRGWKIVLKASRVRRRVFLRRVEEVRVRKWEREDMVGFGCGFVLVR